MSKPYNIIICQTYKIFWFLALLSAINSYGVSQGLMVIIFDILLIAPVFISITLILIDRRMAVKKYICFY